ncbi:hypothetical protein D5086_029081 [Populus alba]|uniref:Uncharacterized protein n=1 Tax=Populus alba TaxID=43335 RepID=A0ACC4AT34_POPAL
MGGTTLSPQNLMACCEDIAFPSHVRIGVGSTSHVGREGCRPIDPRDHSASNKNIQGHKPHEHFFNKGIHDDELPKADNIADDNKEKTLQTARVSNGQSELSMEHRQTWELIFCISEVKRLVAQSVSNSADESSFPFFLFLMTEVIS